MNGRPDRHVGPFLHGLDGRFADLLRREADRLLCLLPGDAEEWDEVLSGRTVLLSEPPLEAEGRTSVRAVVEKAPLAALLAARPDANEAYSAEMDKLRAWALAATLAHCGRSRGLPGSAGTTDRDYPASVGLRAVRRLCAARVWREVRREIPPVPNTHAACREMLAGWSERMRARGEPYFCSRIREVAELVGSLPGRTSRGPRGGGGGGPRLNDLPAFCWSWTPLPLALDDGGHSPVRRVRIQRGPAEDLSAEDAPENIEEAADIARVIGFDMEGEEEEDRKHPVVAAF